MRTRFFLDEHEPETPKSGPKGSLGEDGYTVLARGERGSFNPWGRSGRMDLRNDEMQLIDDHGDD